MAETVRKLAVVAYPTLSDDDRLWIEGVRARHDPLASRIAAHFTLVFPTEAEGHAGALAAHRRRDIPFVPHVTVGAHPQTGECERIANQLNEERRIVRARINSVDVSEMGESMVQTVAEIKLGSV